MAITLEKSIIGNPSIVVLVLISFSTAVQFKTVCTRSPLYRVDGQLDIPNRKKFARSQTIQLMSTVSSIAFLMQVWKKST